MITAKRQSNPRLVFELEKFRRAAGLSQAELARRVSMSPSAINDLEHGRADIPSGANLVALLDELKARPGDIIKILPKNSPKTTIKSLT